jgi:hypothetical protein
VKWHAAPPLWSSLTTPLSYRHRLLPCCLLLRWSRSRADKIRSAIDAIRNSTSLRAVLEWVLAIGNYLNAGAWRAVLCCVCCVVCAVRCV